MSYIGITGVFRLDRETLFNNKQAEKMDKANKDPIDIKVETGWEKGRDGLWRYEIPDPFWETSALEDYVKPRFGEAINLRLIMKDTTILTAYPELDKIKLYVMYSPRKGLAGYFNPDTKGIVVSLGKPTSGFNYQIDSVLLHEIQHLIQEIEGFAKGGDPKVFGRRRYICLAGEVEARNISSRHFLTEDARRHTLRTATQDVPDYKQIIIF